MAAPAMVSELTGGEAEKYGYTDKVEAFPLWMRWWSPTS